MAAQTNHEWDDYNKVITTIASRPVAAAPLMPAPSGVAWPAMGSTLRIATDKSPVPVGRAGIGLRELRRPVLPDTGQHRLVGTGAGAAAERDASRRTCSRRSRRWCSRGPGSNLKVTPVGPPGVETVTAICSADNRPVVVGDLVYGRDGYAPLAVVDASSSRDLAVVATNPARQAMHATIGIPGDAIGRWKACGVGRVVACLPCTASQSALHGSGRGPARSGSLSIPHRASGPDTKGARPPEDRRPASTPFVACARVQCNPRTSWSGTRADACGTRLRPGASSACPRPTAGLRIRVARSPRFED